MSIKRYTKDFWYGIANQPKTKKTVVASTYGAPPILGNIPRGAIQNYNIEGGWINVSGGPFGVLFDALNTEYYFNQDASVRLTDKLKGDYTSVDVLIGDIADYMASHITGAGIYTDFNTYNHPNFPDFPSPKQGLWYGGGTSQDTTTPCAYIRGQFSHSINPTTMVDLFIVDMAIGTADAIWNDNTHMWTHGQEDARVTLHYEGNSPTSAMLLAANEASKISYAPSMPLAVYGPDPSNSSAMVYYNGCTPMVDAGYPKVISAGQFTPFFGAWTTGSGDVDPTDPWEEPDPYEPIPPGPTPPGPVDPVDPVDPVPEPDYPPIDGAAVGIYKIFKPSAAQLQAIAAKLWDPDAWDAIKQMFTNPMDALMGLAIVPVNPNTPTSENVYLGRYNTQISVPRVSNEYVTVDCGSVTIPKFYGSYLDHDPYTKYTLYLPYIGELDISADEITGKTVSIKYHCNVVTGDTVAIVLINNRSCYTAMGNVIRQLPLSQVDFSSVIQTAVSAAATVIQTATSVSSGLASEGVALASGNLGAAMGGYQRAANATAHGVASTLNNVANTKLAYKHAGKIGQGAAQMSVQKPFFTITRPNLSLPEGIDGARNSSQKRYTGYPANFIDELRNFHGLTIVEEAQLNLLGATDAEIAEATELLRGGVIL